MVDKASIEKFMLPVVTLSLIFFPKVSLVSKVNTENYLLSTDCPVLVIYVVNFFSRWKNLQGQMHKSKDISEEGYIYRTLKINK